MYFLSSQHEQGGFSSRSLLLDQHIVDHIDRVRALVFLSQVPYDDVGGLRPSWLLVLWLLNPQRLYTIDRKRAESPEYQPFCYAYEGQGSQCASLDQLSLSTSGDDLTFLNNLGPSFNKLGQICQQNLEEKDIELWITLPDSHFNIFFKTHFRSPWLGVKASRLLRENTDGDDDKKIFNICT